MIPSLEWREVEVVEEAEDLWAERLEFGFTW